MKTDSTIHVMIVDDHEMIRRGLALILDLFDDLELVGQACDGNQAVIVCAATKPDVILMDARMPRMDGISAVRAIHQRFPDIKIILLTNFIDETSLQAALEAGVVGYLLKNVLIDELAGAIRVAHNGTSIFAPEATQMLIETMSRHPESKFDLTSREREVLSLMIDGLSNREIADRLIIGSSTVKNHVSNILSKLSVSNRVEAVTLAIEHNLLR